MKRVILVTLLCAPVLLFARNDAAVDIRVNKANYPQEIKKYALTPCYTKFLESHGITANSERLFKFEYAVKDHTQWLADSAYSVLYKEPKTFEERQKFYKSIVNICVAVLNDVYSGVEYE